MRGYDAGKKILGRKRHLLVDTLGLILPVGVHSAAVQDRDGARLVLPILLQRFGWLRCLFAAGGYAGELAAWVKNLLPRRGLRLEVVRRSDADRHRFKLLPKRRVVERTPSTALRAAASDGSPSFADSPKTMSTAPKTARPLSSSPPCDSGSPAEPELTF